MLKRIFNKKIILIAFILMLLVAIPSSFAEDSSSIDTGDNSTLTLAESGISSADYQSGYQHAEGNNDLNDYQTLNNQDDAGKNDIGATENAGSENQKSSDSNADILSDGGSWTVQESGTAYASLSDAVAYAQSGNTIIGSSLANGETISNITISKDLTIKAENLGDVVLKTSGTSAFTVSKGFNLYLTNIVFKDYSLNSNVRGGVVNNNGNLTLTNCNISNIRAVSTYNYGGAIYCEDYANLTIIDSYFENITTYYAPIYLSSNNAVINGSVFRNVKSSDYASAVYMYGSRVTIENSKFMDSSISKEMIYSTRSTLNIISSEFRNISGSCQATALYTTYYTNATVFNCTFDSLKSTISSSTYNAAGAIYSTGNYINISYSTFKDCNQTGITSNSARYLCGAILADEGDVSHCMFINNNRNPSSSQKANAYDDLYLESGTANNNYWGSNAGPDEGMTNKADSISSWYILTMDPAEATAGYDCEITFNLNKINSSGSIVDGDNLKDINLTVMPLLSTNESFELAVSSGTGSILYQSADAGDETLSIKGVDDKFEFVVNADPYASIYVAPYGDNSNEGIETSPYKTLAFALSQVTERRNIIYVLSGTYNESDLEVSKSVSIVSLGDVVIDAQKNGRIFIADSDVNLVLKDLTLLNGNSVENGGAIYANKVNLTLNNVTIKNSTALNGGALAINGNFNILSSEFINNTASNDGGAIYIYSGASQNGASNIYSISNSNFTDNAADNNGGAISTADALKIKSSYLYRNTAALNGGAIFASNVNELIIDIDENTFCESSAVNGGALYLSNSNRNITVKNNIFIENTANSFGGSIFLKDTNAYLYNNNMGGNEASNGNCIYQENSLFNGVLSFLDGSVINANIGETISLTAAVTDDMENEISGGLVIFTINGNEIDSCPIENGIASISFTINEFASSDYVVSGSYSGLNSNQTIKNGYIHTVSSNWYIEGGRGFEYLSDAISSAKNGDVIYGLAGTYENDLITIDKNLTIKALEKDSVFLKGKNEKIFNITKGATVNLINLTLSNGASKGLGGLIEAQAILNVINCTFKDSAISGSYAEGGAIFMWDKSELNVIGSKFTNVSSTFVGGAIYVYTSTSKLTVTNSSFDNISGGADGSVIFSRSPVLINGSNFTNIKGPFYIGSLSNYYGAIYVGNNLTIDNSRFINITGPRASVIGVDDSYSHLEIYHSVFANNTALNTTIWSIGMYNTINYCIFADNIGVNGNYWDFLATGYYLAESNLNYNYWQSNEGPYYNYNDNKVIMDYWAILELSSDEGMLIANTANDIHVSFNRYTDGENYYSFADIDQHMPDYAFDLNASSGIIDPIANVVNGEATVNYAAPNENTHVIISIEPGDEILEFDVMKTESVIYVSNRGSDLSGEGTYESPYASIEEALKHVSDTKNIIYIERGTYNEHDLNITQSVTIQGQDLENTIINARGQANVFNIRTGGINVVINTLTLTNGRSSNGGAIYADAGYLTVFNTIISSSQAADGGAIYLSTDANIFNNTIRDIASSSNGAIYLNSGNLNLTNNIMSNVPESSIIVNDGFFNALVKYLNNSTVEVPRSTTTILNASVTDDMGNPVTGGSLEFRVNGGLVGSGDVINGIATVEYSVPYKEAVYVISGSYSYGSKETVVKNGAIRSIKLGWFVGDNGYETLEQAIDAANDGDTIIAVPGTYNVTYELLEKSLTIKSDGTGDVVLHLDGRYLFEIQDAYELNLEGLTFENANGYGGFFIYNTYGTVNIDNCTFKDSSLETVTAVIYCGRGILNVNNTNFGELNLSESTTSGRGGAISAVSSIVHVENSVFNRNNAGSYGGAIHLSGSALTVINSTFTNNHAGFRGGAIYGEGGSTLYADNCTFINNSATGYTSSYGGAICVESGQVNISHSVFMNNTGFGKGGAIYVARNSTFNYNIFVNNSVSGGVGDDIYFNWFNETYMDEFVVADYNYWGTNEGPVGNKIGFNIDHTRFDRERWVVLDVSINSSDVILGPDYEILASLTHYQYGDKTYVLEDVMPDYDLYLSALIGQVAPEKITISNGTGSAIYHPIATGNETISFAPSEQKLNFAVNFGSDYLLSPEIQSLTIDYGESRIITVSTLDKYRSLSEELNGKYVIVSYETANGNFTLQNNKLISGSSFSFNLNELTEVHAGDIVIISFALEETSYDATSDSIQLTVNRLNTAITVEGNEINASVGEGRLDVGLFNGDIPLESKEIQITIKSINNTYKYALNTSSNGIASFDLKDLVYGQYTANILFKGDDNYVPASKSIILNVNKILTELDASNVNASEGKGNLSINVKRIIDSDVRLITDSNLEINILIVSKAINETTGEEDVIVIKNISDTSVNGMLNIDLSDLTQGNYTAIISFAGDEKYDSSSAEANVSIYKLNMNLDVNFNNETNIFDVTATVNGQPLSGEIVSVEIGSYYETKLTNRSGKASFDLSELVNGEYNAIVRLVGNDDYPATYGYYDLIVTQGSNSPANDSSNQSSNGTTPGNDNVAKATKIVASNMVTYAINTKIDGAKGKYFTFYLRDSSNKAIANKKVNIGFNGKTYSAKTDSNGRVRFQINLRYIGTYTFAIAFIGDDAYSGSLKMAKITVKRQKIKMTVKKKSVFKAKAKTKKIKVTLKTKRGKAIKGKRVYIKLKGKTYRAKTNKKGVAKIKVKLSKKGKYKFKVYTKADKTYAKKTLKRTLRLK